MKFRWDPDIATNTRGAILSDDKPNQPPGPPEDGEQRSASGSRSPGEVRRWEVGADWIELVPSGSAWAARICRGGWDGLELDLGGVFATEAEGLAWCEKMAGVLARDLQDEAGPP